MAAKKKTSKKPAKSTAKKASSKKKAVKKKVKAKSAVSKRKATKTLAKKKPAQNKPAARKKTKKTKKAIVVRRRRATLSAHVTFPNEEARSSRSHSAGQSGDLQGLSGRAGADSQSVDELVEEGNAFEADVVTGVEAAHDQRREVRTREVPEDDVPQEYLDED
jgi:hypothetical protein